MHITRQKQTHRYRKQTNGYQWGFAKGRGKIGIYRISSQMYKINKQQGYIVNHEIYPMFIMTFQLIIIYNNISILFNINNTENLVYFNKKKQEIWLSKNEEWRPQIYLIEYMESSLRFSSQHVNSTVGHLGNESCLLYQELSLITVSWVVLWLLILLHVGNLLHQYVHQSTACPFITTKTALKYILDGV